MLDHVSQAILDFEQGWWHLPGPKDELIGIELGMSAAAYYRQDSLDDPDARLYDSLTIQRLRRVRDLLPALDFSEHAR
ncbi:MAG TPA: DUF3263 domain-containing protein [Acidimicrobiia bacterium]|nr:DUF3263 domain-containing protein [Acidimicrobiia bacterium]